VDPNATDPLLGEFELRFEDADQPVNAVVDSLEERIAFGADEDPVIVVAQAVVLYLAHRRDELDADPGDILFRTLKSEFDEGIPPAVANWLDEQGIEAP
jgi:hypothetical protein